MVLDETVSLYACWLAPLVGAVFVLFVSHAIGSAIRLRGLLPNEMHCGQCRYIIRGIGSWQCPECGADLQRAGLLTRKSSLPFPLASRIILLLIAVPCPVILLVLPVVEAIPLFDQTRWQLQLGLRSGSSGVQLDFESGSRGDVGWPHENELTISYRNTTEYGLLATVNLSEQTMRRSHEQVPVAAITLARWLKEITLFADEDELDAQARDVVNVIRAMSKGHQPRVEGLEFFKLSAINKSTHRRETPWPMAISFVPVIVVWVIGGRYIVRHYDVDRSEYLSHRRTLIDRLGRSIEATNKARS